jgi:hypothetical protein
MKNDTLSVVVAYLLPSNRRGLGFGVEDQMMHSKIFSHAEGNLRHEKNLSYSSYTHKPKILNII